MLCNPSAWKSARGSQMPRKYLWEELLQKDCISLLGLGCLGNRKLFSSSSGGWKSKIKVSAELVPSEVYPLSL